MPLYEHRYKYGKQKSIMSVEEFEARANQGDFDETFNLTLYLNNTSIGTQTINLTSGRIHMLNFGLNITAFDCGNCSISAYAAPVQYETTTTDNRLVEGFGARATLRATSRFSSTISDKGAFRTEIRGKGAIGDKQRVQCALPLIELSSISGNLQNRKA